MPAPLRDLNLNLLVVLDALLETRSVRRSAERLGVTQSALSHSLRQLRELLADPLFVRSGNQILPTPRAAAMAAPLHQALSALRLVVEGGGGFSPERSTRRFVLATSDAVAVSLLPSLVADLRQRAPQSELSVVPIDAGRIDAQLAAGDVDLAIGPGREHTGTLVEALYPADFAVLSRRGHPEIGARLDLDTYCRLPHAMIAITGQGAGPVDDALAKLGRSRRVVVRIAYFLAAPPVVAQSDLLLTLPRMTAEHFAAQAPLSLHAPPLPLPEGKVSMIWHERFKADPGLAWLREQVRRAGKRFRRPRGKR
ncbi:MAG: LysR family transcriptional regulator [Polyangiaceae bacterium]